MLQSYMYILISTLILSFVFIYLLIRFSSFLGLEDMPNERSAHADIIPRGAGLGFTSAVLISLFIFELDHIMEFIHIYLSIFMIMLLGYYDDKHETSHKIKFIVLILVALYISISGVTIEHLGTYLSYSVDLPTFLIVPFTIFAIVGITNALNLVDGLDGLAGGISIIILFVFFMIGVLHDDPLIIMLSSSFIVAVAVFLFFNWHPANIFMGDSGSLTLGFVISILSIKSIAYIPPAAILFIIGFPIIDTYIVMFRRIQRGMSPFKADKNHIHHFIYKMKINVQFSVVMLIFVQLTLSIVGYQMQEANELISLALFGLMIFVFINVFDQRSVYRRSKKRKRFRKIMKKFLRRKKVTCEK